MFKRMVIVLLILLSSSAFANLEIEVISNKGWGSATVSNIQKLCENVAWHFQKHLRAEHKINGELTVVYHTHPAAFYRSSFGGNIDEYKIGLTVTGTAWSQMSYQFGHEFTHILHNFEDTKHPDPNHWFQEGICEVATVWSLIEMSKSWYSNPPYQNWKGYRLNLNRTYAIWDVNRSVR